EFDLALLGNSLGHHDSNILDALLQTSDVHSLGLNAGRDGVAEVIVCFTIHLVIILIVLLIETTLNRQLADIRVDLLSNDLQRHSIAHTGRNSINLNSLAVSGIRRARELAPISASIMCRRDREPVGLHSILNSSTNTGFTVINNTRIVYTINLILENVASSHAAIVPVLSDSVIQSRIQISVSNSSDLLLSRTSQLAVQSVSSSRGSGSFRLFGLLGLNTGSSAASQHGDSHDTGQHQGSNFLELHSEFFLLMVYKR